MENDKAIEPLNQEARLYQDIEVNRNINFTEQKAFVSAVFSYSMFYHMFFATLWVIVFGIVAFAVDKNCTEPIEDWSKTAFYLLLALIGLSFFWSVGSFCLASGRNINMTCLKVFDFVGFLICLGLFMYILIESIANLSKSDPIPSCGGIYYSQLIYTILAAFASIIIIICGLCCQLFTIICA